MDADEFKAVFNLPFAEAGGFFRKKLNIPTAAWDDLVKGQHALGFMSAGAQKAELLADLRGAVQKAIDGKVDLKAFQEKFDQIATSHGWNYNGGRNWRSSLIYDTNITTAYQAGRWEQFQVAGTEYLMYLHADGVAKPRPLHVAWSGTVLPITDGWWDAHYTPNGWGCHCRTVRAERDEWAAAQATGKGTAPPSPIDPKTGAPVGIDKGWDYNVGKSAEQSYRVLANKFETLPGDLARAWMQEHVAGPAFARFVEGKISGEFPVAVLQPTDMAVLDAQSQTVWFSQDSLLKNKGEIPSRSKGHPELTIDDYRMIPEIIDRGEVYKRSDERLIYLQKGGAVYRVVLKRTGDKAENYLLSLFRGTNENQAMKQVAAKYERIR